MTSWLMVKPGLPYADVIRAVREISELPIAASHVSGEYAMLKAAAQNATSGTAPLDSLVATVEIAHLRPSSPEASAVDVDLGQLSVSVSRILVDVGCRARIRPHGHPGQSAHWVVGRFDTPSAR